MKKGDEPIKPIEGIIECEDGDSSWTLGLTKREYALIELAKVILPQPYETPDTAAYKARETADKLGFQTDKNESD